MENPLVTVVCLCYNHERFVREAIQSVFQQTYSAVQLIVVDDASTDNSVAVIKETLNDYPHAIFISLEKNSGNCRAFNKALPVIQGEFVIDLAADDVLFPDRITEGVKAFQSAGTDYGIHFSDAEMISENGKHLSFHSDRFPHHTIPQGDVYVSVIKKYFICSPTVMVRKMVLDKMGGYDETLAYEDFDLWIRAARDFKFCYTPKALVKKRELKNSLGKMQFTHANKQQWSTYRVCRKIVEMNKNEAEKKALSSRLIYEVKVSLRLLDIPLAMKYFLFWITNVFTRYE